MKWTSYSPRSRQAGLTLIEVVAAIAILGTIVTGIVLAKSRLTRQTVAARQTNAMVRATDELIAGWWVDPQGIPVEQSGSIPGNESLVWQTRLVENLPLEARGAQVVRVEVRDGGEAIPPVDDPVSVVVDLVLPHPNRGELFDADSADTRNEMQQEME